MVPGLERTDHNGAATERSEIMGVLEDFNCGKEGSLAELSRCDTWYAATTHGTTAADKEWLKYDKGYATLSAMFDSMLMAKGFIPYLKGDRAAVWAQLRELLAAAGLPSIKSGGDIPNLYATLTGVLYKEMAVDQIKDSQRTKQAFYEGAAIYSSTHGIFKFDSKKRADRLKLFGLYVPHDLSSGQLEPIVTQEIDKEQWAAEKLHLEEWQRIFGIASITEEEVRHRTSVVTIRNHAKGSTIANEYASTDSCPDYARFNFMSEQRGMSIAVDESVYYMLDAMRGRTVSLASEEIGAHMLNLAD